MKPFLINHLKITNFKSIDSLILENVQPFSVFAGANGCGKSNFFDALNFISEFIRSGIDDALRKHGGYEHVHSQKRRKNFARRFDFEITVSFLENLSFKYTLSINELDKSPQIAEKLIVNNHELLKREEGQLPKIREGDQERVIDKFPGNYSALLLFSDLPLGQLLRNIRLYRIDPNRAKEPDNSGQDPTILDTKGDNLASVLGRMEQNEKFRDTIVEWMEIIVPSIEKINTERQKLDSKTAILFKEVGTKRQFPAHMVSDGTIYALSLLVAILDAPEYSLVLIEEPERGLHPKAINELVSLIREQGCSGTPIWMSTHSEAVVRALHLNELWLVDKKDGKTSMQNATKQGLTDEDFAPLGIDKAWLSNLLNGGLPW